MPRPEKLVITLLAIQVALPMSVMFLHPGFDKKNSLGLDFDFVLLMLGLSGFAWLAGLVSTLQLEERKSRYILWHVVSLLFGILYFALIGE